MGDDDDRSGTVEVRLRFWRSRDPSGQGSFRGSGDYLSDGLVWPTGTAEVPKQQHTRQRAEHHVNNSFEWMSEQNAMTCSAPARPLWGLVGGGSYA